MALMVALLSAAAAPLRRGMRTCFQRYSLPATATAALYKVSYSGLYDRIPGVNLIFSNTSSTMSSSVCRIQSP